MKLNSISGTHSFGLKLPENFAQKILQNCEGISAEAADRLAGKLRVLGDDSFTLTNLTSSCKRNGLFGAKQRTVRIQCEKLDKDGAYTKYSYGDVEERKTPYSESEIFQIIEKVINRPKK